MNALANVVTPETVKMMALFGAKIQGIITTEGYTITSLTEQLSDIKSGFFGFNRTWLKK